MHSLALLPEKTQKFHRFAVGAGEPMWGVGVEFDSLAGADLEIVVSQYQSEHSIQNVHPFVAVVHLWIRFVVAGTSGEHHLESLDTTGAACQRNGGHSRTFDRAEVDARVARSWSADEIVERHAVYLGDREKQLQIGSPLAGFESGQSAGGYTRQCRYFTEGHVPVSSQRSQARTDGVEHRVEVWGHTPSLP